MKEEYPNFNKKETRIEYSNKINDIFQQNDFKWDASPAAFSEYIFIKPIHSSKDPQLNTEAHPFQNIAKMGLSSKKGDIRVCLIAYPSMEESNSKNKLENIGYTQEKIGNQRLFLLIKPINTLESIIDELKEISPILLQK